MWFGTLTGPQRRPALDRRVVEHVVQRRVRVAAEAQLVVEPVEVHARGGEHDAVDDEQRRARPPRPAAAALPSSSIVQPASATAQKTMTISEATSR